RAPRLGDQPVEIHRARVYARWRQVVNTIADQFALWSCLEPGPAVPSRAEMAAITLDGVRKEFANGVIAVDDVSLEIGDGEFIVLVGPSGCGKSTLLRLVAGLEEVSAGRISIGGREVTDLAPRQRDIAMVFQNYALYPHMTVRENLGYGLKVRKAAKDEI